MREFLAFQELLILSFFARPKNETKKGALCRGVFLATGPKNRPSVPKFFPWFQKFFTVPMCYTYKRDKKIASLGSVKISKYFKEKKPDYGALAPDNSRIRIFKPQHAFTRASASPSTTHNGEPRTESREPKIHNPELTTENSQPATDNPKQQTPNNKPVTANPQLTTENREPRTENSQLKTDNPQLTTDSTKQQTPNNKPRTDNPQPKTHNQPLTTENSELTTDNNKQLRVLQLIDTLKPGGAERMAVNLANSLVAEKETSYLCCTRDEGLLKKELGEGVGYLFLNKKNSLDLQAFLKLKGFLKKEDIELVHAHGTSWFWGVLLKLSGLKIKLVWHDHYGESEYLEQRNIRLLKPLSRYFDGIISVNNDLKAWAVKRLKCRAVIQLNNFIMVSYSGNSREVLKGSSSDFKIVCVANLRAQKDHLNLLEAFEKLNIKGVSLHLIGADPDTVYSKKVREEIKKSEKEIYYYDNFFQVSRPLREAHLGVLSSRSEGLPLALLEYALAGLPVVYTDVGQCKEVTAGNALGVPADNSDALAAAIKKYYLNSEVRKQDARCLQNRIKKLYSKEETLPLLLKFYNNLIIDNGRHK
ncbi:Glycosyltransferase involved in cell wall bisynthesis [Salegentibacter holothuriorum]|uniref:Glycosyltransferase involved in cell wall bisynthesis n=1 Tax=Salegentibacter holothuriorum TaxID=241145 RepID=A0A1T5CM93_9FLAO|nr:glycosyltransferase [Salegentibacter holothuriorum]SKB60466.1 Glycosyltransferase involved in cell wall bisynthesis [Salegentibacter holothuriorum]